MAIAIRMAWAVLVLGTLGCGVLLPPPQVVERVPQGPKALELFYYRSYLYNNREPSFDERRKWEDVHEDRVARFLREHQGIMNTTRYTDFKFWGQVVVGSTRDEVRTLLDEPDEQTIDPALMATMAQQHWPAMANAKEAWVYPPGWVLYFDDAEVVHITRKVNPLTPVY
jgi:hypothetical protein